MRALTLIQPWAGLIATGAKRIENRTWRPPADMIGQRFAIHAGKKLDEETIRDVLDDEDQRLDEWGGARLVESPLWRVTSAVLCTVRLVGVATAPEDCEMDAGHGQSWWFNGPYGFVLADVQIVAPIPCKGALGFWTLPDDISHALTAPARPAADGGGE